MGREHRVESGIGGTEIGIQSTEVKAKTFYLVGVPGTRKTEIAEAVAERFENKLAFNDAPVTMGQYAVGTLADYRVELKLALNRVLQEPIIMPTIYTHSILDSLAYIVSTVARYEVHGAVMMDTLERAVLAMTIIGTIMADTFECDHIFFLKGDFDREKETDQFELQAALLMVLDEYGLNYSFINVDDNAIQNVGDIVGGYLD